MKSSKLAGWVLLALGVVIILFSLGTSYNIFTGQKEIYQLFPTGEEVSFSANESSSEIEQMQMVLGEQLTKMIPSDALPTFLNLTSWSILAGILVFGGGKISGLGIKLINKS